VNAKALWLGGVLAVFLVLAGCATVTATELRGTVLTAGDPAPTFRLTDQFGDSRTLSDYNDGKVVVLTFLYTYCRDICPIVTHRIRAMQGLLGDDLSEVSIVAVSVDPERDTTERALEYSRDWGMADKWAYLVGSQQELAPVWASYFVSSVLDEPPVAGEIPAALEVPDLSGVDALRRDVAQRYSVSHQAPVYLIDMNGDLRVLHTLPIDPDDVVHDIRQLLK